MLRRLHPHTAPGMCNLSGLRWISLETRGTRTALDCYTTEVVETYVAFNVGLALATKLPDSLDNFESLNSALWLESLVALKYFCEVCECCLGLEPNKHYNVVLYFVK